MTGLPRSLRAPRQTVPKEASRMSADGEARKKAAASGMSRRTFAFGAAGAAVMVGLGGVRYLPSAPLCRPPGGQDYEHLISGCIHCEKCREVCPHAAIAPATIESGVLNMRTPRMDFKSGWCDFCENEPGGPRCMEVCPTKALSCDNPSAAILGKAKLNRDWCLAAKGMGCHDCADACPYGAMSIGEDHVPVIDEQACNGCGACEFACISMSAGSITTGATDRAIVVVPIEEAGE